MADEVSGDAVAPYPGAGTLRVHPDPGWLAPADPQYPGPNRFDDPSGRIAVRYSAVRLTGCLLETMSRFRRKPEAEERLVAIAGIEPGDVEHAADDVEPIETWLAEQRVGTIRVDDVGQFIELESATMLRLLDKNPAVRDAISRLDPEAHLDVAWLRLGGRLLGRPVSQAVGVAVREDFPGVLGVGYHSRFATDEPCFAIWQSTNVTVVSVPLDPNDPHHADAVRHVAARFEITLPALWMTGM